MQVTGPLTQTSQVVLSTPIDLLGSGQGDGGTFIDVGGSEFCALCIQASSTASNLRVRKTSLLGRGRHAGGHSPDGRDSPGRQQWRVRQPGNAAGEALIERSSVTAINGDSAAAGLTANIGDAGGTVRVLDSTFSGYFGLQLNGPGRTIVQRTAIDAQVIGIAMFDTQGGGVE